MDVGKINGYFGNLRISPTELQTRRELPQNPGAISDDFGKSSAGNAEKQTVAEGQAVKGGQAAKEGSQVKKDIALEDVSLSLQKADGFDLVGRDSDIHSLDMQKAISDMQRDKVLQQYHFFVGSARSMAQEAGDGVVIAKSQKAEDGIMSAKPQSEDGMWD